MLNNLIMEKQKQNQRPQEIAEQNGVGEAINLFLRYELVRNSSVNPFLCLLQNRKCFLRKMKILQIKPQH